MNTLKIATVAGIAAISITACGSVPAETSAPETSAPAASAPVAPKPAEPVKPRYTLAQENAIKSAQSYLDYSAFSKSGLIDQLEFEGFTTAEAKFAVENVDVDWTSEAEESAMQYMETSSFSKSGLADQLAFEGFTSAQVAAGLKAVGY